MQHGKTVINVNLYAHEETRTQIYKTFESVADNIILCSSMFTIEVLPILIKPFRFMHGIIITAMLLLMHSW